MDRLRSMSILLAVVEAGSLSAAARRLGMPLATVSRNLSDLEAHLGTRLLNRSGRRAVLTDAAQGYAASCRRVLDEVEEAERTVAGEYSAPRGELTVTAPLVFGRLHVLPVVTAFLAGYPEIAVRLVQADRVLDLREEHADVAVRIGALPDSSLVAQRLGEIRQVVCASPGYFARKGTPRTPRDLPAHDIVAFGQIAPAGPWRFGRDRSEHTVPVRPRLAVNTAEAAIDAAIAGAGVTRVLSYQVADAVASGRLVLALEAFEPAPWPVSLVHGAPHPLPQKLRAFLDFAAPRLKAVLQEPPRRGDRSG
ncbi:LysR family transcriptional regulator [Kaustia mangrovi]|uniref:LysR family transcriptional regulator n=1 Tax=Kaustia mangrovi TaxID=2593653 RepID=A0A7S8C6E7_9HYPH|nr:LysR family transcriptional regulator [Kaustia mangrovi]QPC44229.1 LysR family transcriptional regulator [Kaustia mangrovi]